MPTQRQNQPDRETRRIASHYRRFFRAYEWWGGASGNGYHFGIPHKWSDIFDNKKMVRNTSELVIDLLNIDTNLSQKILDAGCGSGHIMRLISKRLPPNSTSHIYGITLSEEQCTHGTKQLQADATETATIRIADFEALPFENNSFDRALFVDAICYGCDAGKKRALEEVFRVLKPGGQAVIADVFLKQSPKRWNPISRLINAKLLSVWAVKEWTEQSAFERALQDVGFISISETDLTRRIIPSVLYVPLIHLPQTILRALVGKARSDEVFFFLNIAFLAPLTGIHPAFRYKIIVIKKPFSQLNNV